MSLDLETRSRLLASPCRLPLAATILLVRQPSSRKFAKAHRRGAGIVTGGDDHQRVSGAATMNQRLCGFACQSQLQRSV